jgi:uncharacterized phiE125 gp8 family phage protein
MTVTIVYGSLQHPDSSITPYRSLVRSVQPATEPVTLSEAKAQCRVDISDDDAYLTALITCAREYLEEMLDLSMITQTWQARYDVFPLWEIILPRPPMRPAAVTVTYRDEAGNNQTLLSTSDHFQVDSNIVPGRIYPLYNGVWPAVRGDENSVTVQWQAGYGAAGTAVPSILRQAMLILIAHWYEMRQPVFAGYSQVVPVPLTFQTLMAASGWGGYR